MVISCSSGKSSSSNAAGDKVFKIGILQLIEHDALDASYRGFVDGLKEAGYEDGKNIIIDYQNAQGEQANCVTIGQKFVNDKSDLILAIATPAAQAVANMTKDIPILVTAVTDPAAAKLVADNNAPGGNVTGTSDLTPVKEQIDLLKKLVPSARNIAFLYSSSEQNSKFQIDIAKKKADDVFQAIEGYEMTAEQKTRIGIVRDHLHYIDALIERVDSCINTMVDKYEGYIALLCTTPGIDRSSAITILSEIGIDMTQFNSSKRLCCWAGLTPGNNESAGKKKSVRISRAGVYLKPALVQVAHAAVKDKHSPYYALKYERIAKRRGKKRAIIAIARMILTAVFVMLSNLEEWNPGVV